MPQPESQRQELLLVLRKMRELESEPKAIPDAEGVRSLNKKHLHRLYPLVVKAVGVARDEEVKEELLRFMEAIGDEFGV